MEQRSKKDRINELIDAVRKATGGNYSIRIGLSGKDDDLESLADAINTLLNNIDKKTEKALKMDHALRPAQFCIDNTPIGIFRIGSDGRILYANDAACRSLGYTREELCGMFVFDIDPVFPREKWAEHRTSLRAKGSKTIQTVHRRKNGTTFPVEFTIQYLQFQREEFSYSFVSDISELRQSEQNLKELVEKYRTILENIGTSYFEVDLKGNFTFFNDVVPRDFGYTREELMGMNYRVYTRPENVDRIYRMYHDIYITGKPNTVVNYDVIRKDGSTMVIEMSVSLMRGPTGEAIGFRGVGRDITERMHAEQAFRQSEEKYRTILEAMDEGFFENDLKGNFTSVNDAACRMAGYAREELIGMNYREILSHEMARQVYDIFHRVYETGKSELLVDYEIVRKDGSVRALQSNVILMRDSSGRPSVFCNLTRDVTEKRKVEEALRKSEERYRTMLETMNEGLFENDLQGNYTFVNDAACRMTGYERDELLNMNYRDHTTPELAQYLYEVFHRIYETGNPELLLDYEVIIKDGSIRTHQSNAALIRDPSGKPIGFRNLVRDVTERKKAEEALKKSEERYRMIAENVHDTIWTMDLSTRYTYVSPSVSRIMGFTPDELLNMPVREYLTPASYELVEKMLAEELAREENVEPVDPFRSRTMELEVFRRGGGTVWVEVMATFNRDEKGAIIEILGVTRDITERRRAEEERVKLEEQLFLAQKMESVGRLAGGVAHDFNNMLNVIIGYADLIKLRLPHGDPLIKDVVEIERAAGRSRDLTRQLLAFSRKQIIAPKPIDLNGCIANIQKPLVRLIGEDIDLRFYPGEHLWKIKFDPSQVEQILFNLAVNARDAMPEGGKLTIETDNIHLNEAYCREHLGFTPGQYVLLGVSDDGVGMDRETIQHAFEPFFTTKEIGKGTGLGLATVYGIVKQNGGFINVYSEPGRGTTFKIYIPRSLAEGEPLEEIKEVPVVSGTGRVLLVEDDDMVRTMITEMLEALGYRVRATGNPLEALALCGNDDANFDLVITDVVMPGMSGKDLRDKIKAIRPGIKVLFMSGYTSNVIVHRGVLEEGVHFVQKPFSMGEFAAKVRELIGK